MSLFAGVLTAGGVMAALGLGLSVVLVIADKTLSVAEDARVDAVESMLPGVNCGACGFPGCRAVAAAIVAGQALPDVCPVNTQEMNAAIASLMGMEVRSREKRVARLACAGGTNAALRKSFYEGIDTCTAADLVAGGGKGCPWGCLGFGDCAEACPFDAISMNQYGLPVVDEDKCTACGKCVEVCPRDLFSIHPVSHRLWVACKNRAAGDAARSQCAVACIGCGRCAVDAAPGLISIVNNLAVVDYDKNHLATVEAIQGCPTGAIVWLDEQHGVLKGANAEKVTRKSPLPVGYGNTEVKTTLV